MLLIVHIFFAIGSLVLMAGAIGGRLRNRTADYRGFVQASFIGFVGLMVSGFAMVIANHANLLSVCTSGLAWLAGLVGMYALYARLAPAKER